MKKIISLFLIVFLVSGCSLINPQGNNEKIKQFQTKNGSLILINNTETIVFCSKQSVDELLSNVERHGIKDEFSIADFDTLSHEKLKDKYQLVVSDNTSCQYQNYFLDFTSKENFVVLDEMKLNDGDNITIQSLENKGVFANFLERWPQNVNEVLLSQLLDEVGMDAVVKKDFSIDGAGTYQLIAQPVFRMYYLKDNKQIYDYDFSAIVGFNLKLVKK